MTLDEGRGQRTAHLTRRLRADIEFLASPELEGRGTPSPSLDVAALYLETQLRAAGAEPPPNGSYRQPYRMGEYKPADATVSVAVNGKPIDAGDYVFWNIACDPGAGPFRMPLVYGGHGVNELDGLDLTGSATVVRKGAPWPLDAEKVYGPDRAMGKIVGATTRGARMLVYLSDDLDSGADAESRFFAQMKKAPVGFLREEGVGPTSALNPTLVLRPQALEAALGRALTDADRGPLGAELEVTIDTPVQEATASNVAAIIPGTDPALRDEYVVLSAHYDHLGIRRDADGVEFWPGADDNASGVACVLELARRFAARPPKRSILLLFASGEERATLGSAYYAAHPAVPMSKMGVQINFDMIGRSDGTVEGVADGCPELFARAAELAEGRGIELIADRQPEWRLVYLTDTYHFVRSDIPFLFYFTGFHDDFHQPTDTPDKIRYPEMAAIVEAAADLARHYADGAPLPRFERPSWFRTPPE